MPNSFGIFLYAPVGGKDARRSYIVKALFCPTRFISIRGVRPRVNGAERLEIGKAHIGIRHRAAREQIRRYIGKNLPVKPFIKGFYYPLELGVVDVKLSGRP